MRLSRILVAVCVALSFSTNWASAQINFQGGANINFFGQDNQVYHQLGGFGPIVDTTQDGFRLFGDASFVRTGFSAQNINNSPLISGELLSLSVSRPFQVGPFPVKADFTLSEDFKEVLSNGLEDNPRFEITSRAYVVANNPFLGGPPQLIDALYLAGVDADESRLSGTGFRKVDQQSVVEDFVLGPGLQYSLVYDFSVYAHHDTLVNDPLSIFTLEFGGFSNYNGMEVALDGTVIAPEPASIVLTALGTVPLAGIWWRRRRAKNKSHGCPAGRH